jgi:iron(III) transport system substrate-binding protein
MTLARRRFSAALLAAGIAPAVLGHRASAQQNRNVVVYTAGPEPVRALIPLFRQRTGLEMQVVAAGSGELLQRVRAESQRPLGDALVSVAASTIESAPNLFEPHTPPDYDKVMAEMKLSPRWLPFSAVGETVIAVNTRLVPEADTPSSWTHLADPRWRGRIAYAGTDRSGSAYTQLLTLLHIFGNDAGWALFERILPNLIITGSSSAVAQGVGAGEYALAMTLEDNALRLIEGGAPVRIVYPSEGVTMLPDAMALIARGPNPQGGRAVLDFILTAEAQAILVQQLGRRPVRTDVPGPSRLPPISELRVRNFPMEWAGAQRRAVLDRYTQLVRR